MRNNRTGLCLLILILGFGFSIPVVAQRAGGLSKTTIKNRMLISHGPKGPIQGGESAVTDMVLMENGWVYGSTKATWGAENCHLFRTDGENVEHVLNVTSKLSRQSAISDLAVGKGIGRHAAKADREHQSGAKLRRFPGKSDSGQS